MKADDLARVREKLSDVPWDELREQRVLGKVLVERKQPASSRRSWLVAAPAVAAAGIAFAAWFARSDGPTTPTTATAPVATTSVAAPSAAPVEQAMALADGSKAVLLEGASLQVEEQLERSVRLTQTRGAIRYEVKPNPARAFVVHANDVNVKVRGTVFVVEVAGTSTTVSVKVGRVEVEDGTRHTMLGPGESLRVTGAPEEVDASAGVEILDRPASAAVEPAPPPRVATAADLLAKADAARVKGNLDEAAAALRALVTTHPDDARVPAAWFSLARVERARGRDAAAAKAFDHAFESAPTGPLAEDGLGEAAVSWAAAKNTAVARDRAEKYLKRYPSGVHLERMKAITR